MSHLDNVKSNIFPLSVEQSNIRVALREWHYTGDMTDLGEPSEDCELCDHQNIRYQFEIRNHQTKNSLLIGSECINKFPEISVFDPTSGKKLEGNNAKKLVNADRRKMIAKAAFRRVVQALLELHQNDTEFNIESFIGDYKEKGTFTPNQLKTLIWRFEKSEIAAPLQHFKVSMRRDTHKSQLLQMQSWQLQKIMPSLSSHQKHWIRERRNDL